MAGWIYRVVAALSRLVGLWPVRAVAAVVATSYFVLMPRRLGHSVRFYRSLFPSRSRLHALTWAWRQYHDFARVYSERLEIDRRTDVTFETEGESHLACAQKAGRGAILLMSHFGRWEIGARLLAKRHQGVTLVMGGEAAGRARAGVDDDLRNAGLSVLTVPVGQGKAFDILEAVQVLRNGGIVSLAADRAWGSARVLRLPFLGQAVDVAAAPFALALVSGAPLLTVFAVKLGRRRYRFACEPPIPVAGSRRADRQHAMEQAAAVYLDRLRTWVEAYPEQWQTFGEFLIRPAGSSPAA